jgi:cation:H+ antiporter
MSQSLRIFQKNEYNRFMIPVLLQFLVSAAGVILAARWLTRSAERLARSTRLGQAFVGGVFLAASTSAPEFFVDMRATVEGLPDLAAGDLLGSSVMNLSILAATFLAPGKALWRDSSPFLMSYLTFLAALLTAEAAWLIHVRPAGNLAGIHWGSYLIAATYLAAGRWIFRSSARQTSHETPERASSRAVLSQIATFAAAALVIFFASPLLVASMERIALDTGLDRTFVGTTLLALTTSLPELVSTVTAVRLGAPALAVGNIVGSNAFNMTIFFFMDAVWPGLNLWASLSRHHVLTALLVVTGMSALGLVSLVPSAKKEMAARVVLGLILIVNFIGLLILYELTRGAPTA